MCFLFHKWDHWSEPKKRTMVFAQFGLVIKNSEYIENYQIRRCLNCGKVKYRVI